MSVTIAHHIPFARTGSVPRPFYLPLALALGGGVLALSLTPFAADFPARVALFYLGASLAYGLMPYVRRGDIPLVAAWVVLLSELSPCLFGQLISPQKVAADVLGVVMAVAPIYIARMRQVQQGDTRPIGRRASERTD
jgi:hypothetical protein